ncbi:hypothetical protein MFLAVUS_001849 [Mucor flavus]|uniref:Uncharacterized protein n=1 Tax=Mucor flavus TaxID=439312 RepID=A0ABP9YNL8_9FUNG
MQVFCKHYRLFKVLRHGLSEQIQEQELSTRLVDAFLSSLFDDPDNNILLSFTGIITVDGKHRDSTKKSPDITTTSLDGLAFGPGIGFGEVKQYFEANNDYGISGSVVFYINTLLRDGLCISYELAEVVLKFTDSTFFIPEDSTFDILKHTFCAS